MQWWHALIALVVCFWIGFIFIVVRAVHRMSELDIKIHEENEIAYRDTMVKSEEE